MPEILNAKPDLTKESRFQRDAEEERKDGVCESPNDTVIYSDVMGCAVSKDLQKPTEDTFQGKDDKTTTEKRNACRAAALCLGLLTLLLLAGITGLGIHYFQVKTDWGSERGRLLQWNSSQTSEIYHLTQKISQSEGEISNITNQRDELQKMLNESHCCPRNWTMFHNHCYIVSNANKTWNESKKDCESRRAYLVIITSDAEQDYITSGLEGNVWIGLKTDGDNWTWVDGSPLTEGFLVPQQDNDDDDNYRQTTEISGHGDKCVETYEFPGCGDNCIETEWNALSCGESKKWICEMEI